MRWRRGSVVVGVMAACVCISGAARTENAVWSSRTAYTTPPGRAEFNLTTPSHYPLDERQELFADLLLMVLAPNVGYKRAWGGWGRLALSTRHRLSSATLLRSVTSGGDPVLLITLEQELVLGWRHAPSRTWITATAGLSVTPRWGQAIPVIHEPLLYTRVGNAPWSPRAGVAADTVLWGRVYARAELQGTWLPGLEDPIALEPRASISYRTRSWHAGAGALATYVVGRGRRVIPTLDVGVAID